MNITVRNIPDDIVKVIKKRAKKNRRSLNSEIVVLLEKAIDDLTPEEEAVIAKRQMKALSKFIGKWEDDRSTEEIIKDIYESRTIGRDIIL